MAELSKLVVTLVSDGGEVVASRDIAVGTHEKLEREFERWTAVAKAAAEELRKAEPEAVSYRLKMEDF